MQGHNEDLTLQLRKEEQLLIINRLHQPNQWIQLNQPNAGP